LTSFNNLLEFAEKADSKSVVLRWFYHEHCSDQQFELAQEHTADEYQEFHRVDSPEKRMFLMFLHHATQE